jgi:hypothetical protein
VDSNHTIPALEHEWSAWDVTITPTCTEDGEGSRVCARCGSEDDNGTVSALGHQWGEWTVTTAAVFCTAGVETRTCTRDDSHKDTRSIAAIGHDWGEWIQIKPTAVTNDGEERRVCGHDHSHEETRTIYATGTPGLKFEFGTISEWIYDGWGNGGASNYNGGYIVTKGTVTEGEVYIPAYWRENVDAEYFPVLEIGYIRIPGELYAYGGFSGTDITTVHIGTNVKTIMSSAFSNCSNLTSVIIPDSVTNIGGSIFYNCTSLTSLTIPDSITSIGGSIFGRCFSLANVAMGNNVPHIGYSSFNSCVSLTNVTIPNSVTRIYPYAFRGSGITSVTIPASVKIIETGAFYCNDLTSVTFVGTISSNNFSNDTLYDYANGTSWPVFIGDLRDKFYETDQNNGTPGTYMRSSDGYTWTKQ